MSKIPTVSGESSVSAPRTAPARNAHPVTGADSGQVEGKPQKTIDKMNKIEKAALKPEQPSDKDKQVAREAVGARLKAESELKSAGTGAPPYGPLA